MAKISIVDNDQANVSSLTKALEVKGHSLSFFTTSAALMNALQKKKTDMIIIGVELDGEDGRDLSKFLHTESPYKNIPVILTSPFYHTETEIKSFSCDELISLPFDPAGLPVSIDNLLAKKHAKESRIAEVTS
jgi:DNA-binding NtrC family response regulator